MKDIFKISGRHSCVVEELSFMGCGAGFSGVYILAFQRNMLHLFPVWRPSFNITNELII